jgi:hypothetical protein
VASSPVVPFRAPREWGDGATARTGRHIVEDISYAADYILCSDGLVLHGIADGKVWQGHGGKLLTLRGLGERQESVAYDPEASARAIASLLAITRACTCATSSVSDCPNYMTGDEVEDE